MVEFGSSDCLLKGSGYGKYGYRYLEIGCSCLESELRVIVVNLKGFL